MNDSNNSKQTNNLDSKEFVVLVFGNKYLPEDNLAIKVADKIKISEHTALNKKIVFKHSEDLNDLLTKDYSAVLDVAYGIPRVVVLKDLNQLTEHKLVSLHDYDVSFFLKLMKAMGSINDVKIIAIPINYDLEKAIVETASILDDLKE